MATTTAEVTEEEAAELTAELVSIDSQNPPGRERELAEYVHRTLTGWGIDAELVFEPFEDRPQVIARVGKASPEAGTLVLNGHLDVVPPGDLDEWTRDPFVGEIEDGRVYGRGASDMKSGVATAMLAGRAAVETGLEGELILTFAVGEETAEPGTKTLVEGLEADYGVVLEPTELVVDTAGKGLAWYVADVAGESCHASGPHLGRNALAALLSIEDELTAYQERIGERSHELLGESLCTPTIARAGDKENVVPARAEVTLDRRFLPSEDVEAIDREIDALFDPVRERGFDVTVSRTRTYDPAEIPVDSRVAETFRRHAHDVAGVATEPHAKRASTDQRNLVNDAGIPAIIWGPGTPEQCHTADEWARVDRVVEAVEVIGRAVDELCAAD